jgi:hypothetical protein
MKKNIALAVLGAWFGVQICAAGPLWTPGTGVPGNPSYAVTYGQNLYVAVGASGGLITSTDGTDWSTPSATDYIPSANNLNAIAYGDGTFIAVGDNGWTVYSSDGVHWTGVDSGITLNDLQGVVYAADHFVAVGQNGTIITSKNGLIWLPSGYASGTMDTNDDFSSVTYGNGTFVAVGDDGNTTFASTDAATWTQGGNGLNNSGMTGVAFGNGVFVMVDDGGNIANSADGSNWTPQAGTGTELNGVAYGNGFFVAVGDGGVIYLSSGTNFWTENQFNQDYNLYGIGYGGGLFVAVGDQGTALSSSLAGISPNQPELNWALATYAPGTTDTSDGFSSVAYGNGTFVAVGDDGDTTFASTDAVTWTQGGNGLNDSGMNGVTFGNGQFVMVDDGGNVATSADGIKWTPQTSINTELNGVAWDGGTYVAVGNVETTDGVVYISPLATRWTPVDPGVADNLYAITSGPGPIEFVAVGQSGTVITSSDLGANWMADTVTNLTASSLNAVTYGGGHYVVVGDSGTILSSTDGINWVAANYMTTGNNLNGVAYGDGVYVAVGDNGWTAVSLDSINWTSISSSTLNNLQAVTYGGSGFVAVGENGVILNIIIPKLGPIVTLPSDMVQVTVTGGISQSCQILYSTDLVHWTPLTTVPLNSSGAGQFTDAVTPGGRFYRAQGVGP